MSSDSRRPPWQRRSRRWRRARRGRRGGRLTAPRPGGCRRRRRGEPSRRIGPPGGRRRCPRSRGRRCRGSGGALRCCQGERVGANPSLRPLGALVSVLPPDGVDDDGIVHCDGEPGVHAIALVGQRVGPAGDERRDRANARCRRRQHVHREPTGGTHVVAGDLRCERHSGPARQLGGRADVAAAGVDRRTSSGVSASAVPDGLVVVAVRSRSMPGWTWRRTIRRCIRRARRSAARCRAAHRLPTRRLPNSASTAGGRRACRPGSLRPSTRLAIRPLPAQCPGQCVGTAEVLMVAMYAHTGDARREWQPC
jgi:hypothetical protein